MYKYNRRLKLFAQTLGQETSGGWGFIVWLIIGLFVLAFLLWLGWKSGRTIVEQLVAR